MDHSGPFLFSELFCGTPPSCLKVIGWVVGGGGGGLQDFIVSPSPLWVGTGSELGVGDWGLRGWGLGLDNNVQCNCDPHCSLSEFLCLCGAHRICSI